MTMEPSLLRDILAAANEARRGDEWVNVHGLCERTGMGYMAARAKAEQLVERELLEAETHAGVRVYRATAKGAELLK